MALNKEFYASMFAASTRAHAAAPPSAAPAHARPFAAHAKKEFDLTSFLKDLAAVRDGDAIGDLRVRRRARARDGDARGATARMDWVIFYDCHRDVREGDGRARARGRRRRRARRDRGIDRWPILWTAVGGGVCQVTIGRWSRPVVEI